MQTRPPLILKILTNISFWGCPLPFSLGRGRAFRSTQHVGYLLHSLTQHPVHHKITNKKRQYRYCLSLFKKIFLLHLMPPLVDPYRLQSVHKYKPNFYRHTNYLLSLPMAKILLCGYKVMGKRLSLCYMENSTPH